MMPFSADILALILLGFIAFIIFFSHSASASLEAKTEEEEGDAIFHQNQFDPTSMNLPLTGLNEEMFFTTDNAFIPAEIKDLLLSKAEQTEIDGDAMGLAAAMRPGPKADTDKNSLHMRWAITSFVVLLGLIFLLLWMLTLA